VVIVVEEQSSSMDYGYGFRDDINCWICIIF